jgi:hypothetical protein
VLWANGIPAPGATLSAIRTEALVLERDQPSEAACVRQAKAIINAAQSDFVGKINNWFDQTMSRVTQRYGAYARFITVLSAAIVAFSLQFDSLELLRRLSIDSSLRASLVDEAKVQQTRVEALTTAQSDELAAAKAKRDEIDATLVKLRAPSLAILPDHLLWQPVPEARLPRNPLWTHQYPQRYELIAGGGSYPVTPRWQEEFFTDLKVAIDASGAPVTTSIEKNGVDVVFITAEPAQVRVCANEEKDEKGTCTDTMARGFREVAEVSLAFSGTWRAREPGTAIVLAIDDETPVPVVLECTETDPPKALKALAA